jgi:hypothetical protein
MRIENLKIESRDGVARASATVIWEDVPRPPQEVFFEVPEAFGDRLAATPNAFLTAAVLPAMRHGERRVAINGDVCPILRRGLEMNLEWFRYWYGDSYRLPVIEARAGSLSPANGRPRGTALFLSGGIDSLFTLRANRLSVSLSHPASISTCVVVDGFDLCGGETVEERQNSRRRLIEALSSLAGEVEVEVLPVYTNLRRLEEDNTFWTGWFFGAGFAAVAHACAPRVRWFLLSSGSDSITKTGPWGSTAALDPNYSSSDVNILHEGLWVSRLEKVRTIAAWDAGRNGVRVCTRAPLGSANCGTCEKCVRTKLELIAVEGDRDDVPFTARTMTADLIERFKVHGAFPWDFYAELVEPFTRAGRLDLVEAIRRLEWRYKRSMRPAAWRRFVGAVKRFDWCFLGGRLLKAKQLVVSGRNGEHPRHA